MSSAPRSKLNIFVSHNHNDDSFGHRLVDDLRDHLNKDDSVWYDSKSGWSDSRHGLRPGDKWQRVIRERLMRCNVFIVILSKAAVRSRWVRYELDIIIPRAVTGRVRIIAILVEECKVPADLKNMYQMITYFSPDDYARTFNEVLKGLGLPLVPEDPDIALQQNVIRQINSEYTCKNWLEILNLFSVFNKRFPEVKPPAIYIIFARALLERGEVQRSLYILQQITSFNPNGQEKKLLDEYTQSLVEKNLWEEVVYCIDWIKDAIPDPSRDASWSTLRSIAASELNKKKSSTATNGFYARTSRLFDDGAASFTSQNNTGSFMPPNNTGSFAYQNSTRDFTQTTGLGSSTTENPAFDPFFSSDALSNKSWSSDDNSADLSEEESNISWDIIDKLANFYVFPHDNGILKLGHIIRAVVFDIVGFFLLFSVWNRLPWWIVLAVLTIGFIAFIGGLLSEERSHAILSSLILTVIWGVIGFSFGALFIGSGDIFNIMLVDAQATFILIGLAIVGAFLSFLWHLQLFRRLHKVLRKV